MAIMSPRYLPTWAWFALLCTMPSLLLKLSSLPQLAVTLVLASCVLIGIRTIIDWSFGTIGIRSSVVRPFFAFARSTEGSLLGFVLSFLGAMSLSSDGILSVFSFLLGHRSSITVYMVINTVVLGLGLFGFAGAYWHFRHNNHNKVSGRPCIGQVSKDQDTSDERSVVTSVPRMKPFDDDVLEVTRSIHRLFRGGYGGVIAFDASSGRALTIEFYGPGLNNGVNIQYSASPTVKEAKDFTRCQHSDYFQIPLKHAKFGTLVEFLYQHSTPVTNFASGRRLYRSVLP